jgi:Domain of unknown function (DUF4384)
MEKKERHMLTSLLLLASIAGPATGPAADTDPPIHVWYNSDGHYTYGDRAKVYAKSADQGYLVVLRADMNGRVRVLAPIDPQDDQHVNGGKKYELKGRGGREAFVTEDTTGQGVVLAAWSKTPFDFSRFEKKGRWDNNALTGDDQQANRDDPEARLTSIAHEMQPSGGHFDYDLATYTVSSPPRYARMLEPYGYPYGWGWWGYSPWWGVGPGFGSRVIVVRPVPRTAVVRPVR